MGKAHLGHVRQDLKVAINASNHTTWNVSNPIGSIERDPLKNRIKWPRTNGRDHSEF